MTLQDLPSGWETTTLGTITLPRGVKVKPSDMPDAPFVGLEHIEAHTMRLLDTAKASEVKSSGSYFGKKDVIYGRLRPYLNKVYMPNFGGLASGEFIVFPSQPDIDNAYLKYFLNQWEFVSFVTRLNTGDRPRVDFGQFADYPFPLAPLPEQHGIVAEIETQFTRLDASVAALKRARANLKRYRASVLKSACEGTLVPTEVELARSEGRDYEPAGVLLERILVERRARWESQEKRRGEYKEPAPPDTSALPELSEGWVWATTSQVSNSMLGKMLDKKRTFGNPLPYLRNLNVRWDSFDLSNLAIMPFVDTELDRYSLLGGDVLVAEGGEPGRAAVWPGDDRPIKYQKALHRVRLSDGVLPKWLVFTLWASAQTGTIERYFTGSTIKHFTGESLERFAIPLPPLAEQRRIVAEVERRLSVVQKAEVTVEASLARAERLRQSILKQAFSGKLVPQDPGDEPASALLERIRAEREAEQESATGKDKSRASKTRKATA